jgi:pimeloyl-ACP methyl ester carboxylesterase
MSPARASGGSGPGVSGGGTVAVETDVMVVAAQRLAAVEAQLDAISSRTAACLAGLAGGARRVHATEALLLLQRARAQAASVSAGLRTATVRYGMVEHAVLDGQRGLAAALAALTGGTMRLLCSAFGPGGALLVAGGTAEIVGALVLLRTLERTVETGRFAPQSDPVLLRALALVLASLDDGVRGALLVEQPADLLRDDPSAPFGIEQVGSLLAALLLRPAGAPLSVTATRRRDVRAPRHLVDLVDRIPDGAEPAGQIRTERYDGPDGPQWIVFIAGTVTFARDSGDEPFDLASDVLGVAHRTSDSERAVLQAMRDAGVGRDEPVLLVGHSQGALNAVRVAEDGGYRVGGVVQLGGPTGQITLPDDVPVLAVEHDEDLVTALGGTAASGAAGLRRLVVRRSLPDGGFGVPTSPATAAFPAHDLGAYRRTLAAAESSDDARVAAFTRRIGMFLDADHGVSTRWRARRISAPPGRTGDAGSAPRPSR